MELRHLEHFVAVAEERHFTRAAKRCHIAQSALSNSIRDLERNIGAKLFVRTTRRVELTVAGEALLPEARRTLDAARRARDAVSQLHGGVVGTVVIGHSLQGAIGSWLAEYHRVHPNVRIGLEQGSAPGLIDGVRSGRLDVALAAVPEAENPPGVVVLRREDVPLGIACAVGHPLAGRNSAAASELRDETFVAVAPSHPAAPLAASFFTVISAASTVQAADAPSALELVAKGFGISLMPRTWTVTRPELHWLEIAPDPPRMTFGIVISERPPSLPLQALLTQLRQVPRLVDP